MRYVARVIAVFPEGTAYPNTFDAWDTVLILSADQTRNALRSAVSTLRSVFEEPANRKGLGYSTKPIIYAVASLTRYHNLKNSKPREGDCGVVVTEMMSLSRADVESLRARHDISVPLRALHVEEA